MGRRLKIASVLVALSGVLFFSQNFSTLDFDGILRIGNEALVSCPHALPAATGTFTLNRDVIYTRKISQVPGDVQALNFYRPSDTKLRPLMIVIHGGGWQTGSKDEGPVSGLSSRMVRKGFAVANFNYPLVTVLGSGERVNQFPIPVQGLRCGLRYLNKNAAALGIDKTRVVVYGASAGGNLAGMVAYAGNDESGLLDSPDCEQRSQPLLPIKAAIFNSGVYALRLATAFNQPGARAYLGDPSCDPLAEPEVQACHDLRWAKGAFASPRQYIRADSPATFAIHSIGDKTVNYEQLQWLSNTLTERKVLFEAISLDGTNHVPDIFDYSNLQSRSAMCRMIGYLDRVVGPLDPP